MKCVQTWSSSLPSYRSAFYVTPPSVIVFRLLQDTHASSSDWTQKTGSTWNSGTCCCCLQVCDARFACLLCWNAFIVYCFHWLVVSLRSAEACWLQISCCNNGRELVVKKKREPELCLFLCLFSLDNKSETSFHWLIQDLIVWAVSCLWTTFIVEGCERSGEGMWLAESCRQMEVCVLQKKIKTELKQYLRNKMRRNFSIWKKK